MYPLNSDTQSLSSGTTLWAVTLGWLVSESMPINQTWESSRRGSGLQQTLFTCSHSFMNNKWHSGSHQIYNPSTWQLRLENCRDQSRVWSKSRPAWATMQNSVSSKTQSKIKIKLKGNTNKRISVLISGNPMAVWTVLTCSAWEPWKPGMTLAPISITENKESPFLSKAIPNCDLQYNIVFFSQSENRVFNILLSIATWKNTTYTQDQPCYGHSPNPFIWRYFSIYEQWPFLHFLNTQTLETILILFLHYLVKTCFLNSSLHHLAEPVVPLTFLTELNYFLKKTLYNKQSLNLLKL